MKKIQAVILCVILIVSVFQVPVLNVSAASKAEKCYKKLLHNNSYILGTELYSLSDPGVTYTICNIDGKGSPECIIGNYSASNAETFNILFCYSDGKACGLLQYFDMSWTDDGSGYLRCSDIRRHGTGTEYYYKYDKSEISMIAAVEYDEGVPVSYSINGKIVSERKYKKKAKKWENHSYQSL